MIGASDGYYWRISYLLPISSSKPMTSSCFITTLTLGLDAEYCCRTSTVASTYQSMDWSISSRKYRLKVETGSSILLSMDIVDISSIWQTLHIFRILHKYSFIKWWWSLSHWISDIHSQWLQNGGHLSSTCLCS